MTIPLPSMIESASTFFGEHLIYWVVLVALVFELRYLLHKNRREAIAMSRLGAASRDQQPVFFYLLWALHIVATSFFTLMFIAYLSDLL